MGRLIALVLPFSTNALEAKSSEKFLTENNSDHDLISWLINF